MLDGGPGGFVDDLELGGISLPVGFLENFRNCGGAGGIAEDGEEDGGGFAGEEGFLAVDEGGGPRTAVVFSAKAMAGSVGGDFGLVLLAVILPSILVEAGEGGLGAALETGVLRDSSEPSSTPSERFILLARVPSMACSMASSDEVDDGDGTCRGRPGR